MRRKAISKHDALLRLQLSGRTPITDGVLDNSSDVTCANGGDCYTRLRYLTGTFNVGSIITARVTNDPDSAGNNPTGLLVQGAAVAIPEPSTYVLISIAGAAGFYLRRRRTQRIRS